jgi:serine/threonine protein kinase
MRSDVWSLGVVLTNIVAGRNAWHSATSNDVCFRAFVTDPNYLFSALRISPETHRILKRTFDLDPASRITIPDLRKAILKVKTFFSDDCHFAQPSLIPADSSLAIPVPVLRVVNCLTMECVSSSAEGVSHLRVPSSPAEEYLYPSPDPHRTRYTPSPEIQYIPRPRLFRNSSSTYSDEDNQWLFRVSSNKLLYGLGIDFGFEESFALHACSSVVSTMPSKAKLLIRTLSAPIVIDVTKLLLRTQPY